MTLVGHNLGRVFDDHVAVADATVALQPGRITGLVGPNGCGKTTLMLMLSGLLAPSRGCITFDGRTIDPAHLRSMVGWMPDMFGTWESLTASEILTTFARLYGQPPATAKARALELLAMVHLSEFAHKPAAELSRGQKQRLGFARALVNWPRILLLDEPASGMDPRSRVELRDQLRWLAGEGCAVLVSSHILTELAEMVDDVVLMVAGRTQAPTMPTGQTWRIRYAGRPASEVVTVQLPDEHAAAEHLTTLVANGAKVAEFTRVGHELEDAYLALNVDRT